MFSSGPWWQVRLNSDLQQQLHVSQRVLTSVHNHYLSVCSEINRIWLRPHFGTKRDFFAWYAVLFCWIGFAIKRSWDMERCYYYGTMVAFWCFFTAMVLYYYGMNCRLKNAAFTAMNSTLLYLLSKGDGIRIGATTMALWSHSGVSGPQYHNGMKCFAARLSMGGNALMLMVCCSILLDMLLLLTGPGISRGATAMALCSHSGVSCCNGILLLWDDHRLKLY